MLSMIFACDEQNAIGKDGDLPWRQSTDLQHFKHITLGGTIVMGRKTWDSLPGILPNRRHLVMSRSDREDVETITFEEVISLAEKEVIFIIGGGEIYRLFMPYVNKIYRTIIHCKVENADTFAPEIDQSVFQINSSKFTPKTDRDQFDMTFETLTRID
ncbi:MAG: dihydrofolate reductase [Candidatus Thermoplasmatota archaeon]|nr:dihydrofolate reductase [Candidatus Thermoplasmatota archaeon]